MKKIKTFVFLIGLFFLNFAFVNFAFAETTKPAVSIEHESPNTYETGSNTSIPSITFTGLENPSKLSSLDELFSKYLPQAIGLIGGMAFMIVLLVGGFQYITSAGNEEQAERGKKTIMWAVIGIIVIAIAAAAVNWFMGKAGAPSSSSSPTAIVNTK
jgi:FtsH-binding integral membrane protein